MAHFVWRQSHGKFDRNSLASFFSLSLEILPFILADFYALRLINYEFVYFLQVHEFKYVYISHMNSKNLRVFVRVPSFLSYASSHEFKEVLASFHLTREYIKSPRFIGALCICGVVVERLFLSQKPELIEFGAMINILVNKIWTIYHYYVNACVLCAMSLGTHTLLLFFSMAQMSRRKQNRQLTSSNRIMMHWQWRFSLIIHRRRRRRRCFIKQKLNECERNECLKVSANPHWDWDR